MRITINQPVYWKQPRPRPFSQKSWFWWTWPPICKVYNYYWRFLNFSLKPINDVRKEIFPILNGEAIWKPQNLQNQWIGMKTWSDLQTAWVFLLAWYQSAGAETCHTSCAWRSRSRCTDLCLEMVKEATCYKMELGGGFKKNMFTPILGEMIQFDSYFSNGLAQPPTREHLLVNLWSETMKQKVCSHETWISHDPPTQRCQGMGIPDFAVVELRWNPIEVTFLRWRRSGDVDVT